MRNPFKKFKVIWAGYFFLIALFINAVMSNVLRIFGVNIVFTNTTRVFVILQIIAIATLAWILGWVAGSRPDNDDKS